MAGFRPKLHLPFARWPDADKALWQHAIEADDPFSVGGAARLSPASRKRYFMGWRRFLGFLAIAEPEALEISPADRLRPERIKRFAKHLDETCSPGSRATGVEAVYNAARLMMPDIDFGWLKEMKTRLHRAVPPKGETRPAITSLQLLKLGQELMEEVTPKLGTKIRLDDAVQYRDGLMIALTAFVPPRRKNLAALDMVRHVRLEHDSCTIVIPKGETKTGSPIEFEVPPLLLPYLHDYCSLVRPRLNPGNGCTALWVSAKGRELSYAAIGGVFARHSARRLGLRLCPHDVRAAAATTWAVFSPEQIGVAQELLAHKDIRTTTTHYNRARGIEASRAYSQAVRQIRRGQGDDRV
jgi:integrase/recombinase XerD